MSALDRLVAERDRLREAVQKTTAALPKTHPLLTLTVIKAELQRQADVVAERDRLIQAIMRFLEAHDDSEMSNVESAIEHFRHLMRGGEAKDMTAR